MVAAIAVKPVSATVMHERIKSGKNSNSPPDTYLNEEKEKDTTEVESTNLPSQNILALKQR